MWNWLLFVMCLTCYYLQCVVICNGFVICNRILILKVSEHIKNCLRIKIQIFLFAWREYFICAWLIIQNLLGNFKNIISNVIFGEPYNVIFTWRTIQCCIFYFLFAWR